MTSAPLVAAVTRAASPELLGLFVVGAVVAIGRGLSWAFDLRGVIGRRTGGTRVPVLRPPGQLRLLGSLLTAAGVVLLCVAYLLWRLG